MTQDEIIKLAMEYGFTGGFDAEGNLTFDATFVEVVAEAVAKTRKATLEEMIYEHPTTAIKKAVEYAVQVEREACAKVCELESGDGPDNGCCPTFWNEAQEACAAAIRARAQADRGEA